MADGPPDRVVVRIDAEFLDLVRAYLANREKDVEAINAALQRRDFETIYRVGHNMQGSGRTFGFDELTVIGAELQRAVTAADTSEIARLEGRLRNFVSRVELEAAEVQQVPLKKVETAFDVSVEPTEGPKSREEYVLVVDDQETNRMIVRSYLEREGYAVRQASSGDEALAALRQRPRPAVVLLDVYMSGMNGFEVCRRIKSDPDTQIIPVLLLTGFQGDEDRARGADAGADGYLSKPVDRHELLARVSALTLLRTTSGTLQDEQLSRTQ